jgi:hypothetical protein
MIEPYVGVDNVICTGVYASMAVYLNVTSSTDNTQGAGTACKHYKKRSWLSSNLLGYRPKRHVKQRTLGASHA